MENPRSPGSPSVVDRRVIGVARRSLSRARAVSLSQELEDDLEWKLIYVGSADDEEMDQTLEEVMVGPVPVGVNKFVFHSPAPEAHTISEDVLVGVTVILITCSYRDKEFVRVGYYVNNYYHNRPCCPGRARAALPPPVDAEARAAQAAAQARAMPPPAPTADTARRRGRRHARPRTRPRPTGYARAVGRRGARRRRRRTRPRDRSRSTPSKCRARSMSRASTATSSPTSRA